MNKYHLLSGKNNPKVACAFAPEGIYLKDKLNKEICKAN